MDDTDRSRRGDDQALDDPAFSDLFDAMRAASSGPAPAMGPELSAMVSGAVVASLTARRTRVRTAIVGLAVLGAVAGGAGAAAAAGVSPSHAARFATTIIQRLPGVDSGAAGVEEETARGTEQRESPSPTLTQTGDDEPGAGEASPAMVSPSHRPSGADDDERSRQTGLAPDEDERTATGETSSTDVSDDGDARETRSTDTDEGTAASSTSTEDDADSETSRDTDDSSDTSQEQSDG